MNLKRLSGSVAIAGVVGAFTLGTGAGIADADSDQAHSTTAEVQPADWHGNGNGNGHGWDRGYGHDYYRGSWPVDRWWHPWVYRGTGEPTAGQPQHW